MTEVETLAAQYQGFLTTASFGRIPGLREITIWDALWDENQIPVPPPSEWLTPDTNILGKRMERFLHWQILQSELFDIVCAGLQIQSQQITIGEIDFLLRERSTGLPIHLEMAYKLYLYRPGADSHEEIWTGPNLRDSFDQKIHKLKTRQFALLQHPATIQKLKELDIESSAVIQQLCFKAQLYLPLFCAEIPAGIESNQVAGYWIRSEQLKHFESCEFYIPRKINWSILPENWPEWYPFAEAERHITHLHREKISPLCWIRKSTGVYQRVFVVWW